MSEITAITPQVKDKTRCNIFVDGRFYCGLTLETTLRNRLKVGQTIDPEKLSQMQLESEKETALDKALHHLTATAKTEKQIRDFLSGKGFLPAVCDFVVERLKSYNFLNDGEYAKSYVSFAAKKKGNRLIRMELRGKGVSDEEIDGALDELSKEDELSAAKTLLEKYLRGKTADKATLQKACRYLMGKGFEYDSVKQAIAELGEFGGDDYES
ncbi:MAG: RecX family transcriptional regulator [Clostridia bacterium]|nr:RecX family transcriptional regulator [Clostridia bacterium]